MGITTEKKKNENLPSSPHIAHKAAKQVISRRRSRENGCEMNKNWNSPVQIVQNYCYVAFTMQICDVLVTVAVVNAHAHLSLAKRNRVELFRKSHLFGKFIEISSGIRSNRQHKDERSIGWGIFEHKGQVCGLKKKQEMFKNKRSFLQQNKGSDG